MWGYYPPLTPSCILAISKLELEAGHPPRNGTTVCCIVAGKFTSAAYHVTILGVTDLSTVVQQYCSYRCKMYWQLWIFYDECVRRATRDMRGRRITQLAKLSIDQKTINRSNSRHKRKIFRYLVCVPVVYGTGLPGIIHCLTLSLAGSHLAPRAHAREPMGAPTGSHQNKTKIMYYNTPIFAWILTFQKVLNITW